MHENRWKFSPFLLLWILGFNALAGDERCFVSVHPAGFAASFSMKHIDARWRWFEYKRTAIYPEYQWMIEPGVLNSGKFITKGVYLSYAVGSFKAGPEYIQNGTIEDLLKQGWGSMNYRRRDSHTLFDSFDSDIFARRKLDSVVIMLSSKNATEVLLNDQPTHFRMTYSSMNGRDNYVCIADVK